MVSVASLSVGCGCGSKPEERPARAVVKINPDKPEDTLFEQMRAGAFQFTGVIETLDAAVGKLKDVKPGSDAALKAGLEELTEAIDAAGAALADYTDEPDRARLAKKFPEYDERRIRAIGDANDALHNLDEAAGIATTLASDKNLDELNDVADLLDLAIEDIKDAIASLGGKVETG